LGEASIAAGPTPLAQSLFWVFNIEQRSQQMRLNRKTSPRRVNVLILFVLI